MIQSGLLSLVMLGLVTFGTTADAATKIRITMQLPITSPLSQNLVSFKEKVEAESNGDLLVEIYPAAQLFTDKEVPTAVASGQIEMGSASLVRFAGTIPAVDIFSVPFLFNSLELVGAATDPDSKIRQLIDQAMAEKGARPLWWQPYGLTVLLTRGKPVTHPDHMQGLKIRTFGKALEMFVNTVGGAATNIAASRQYLAYERGTVDGGMTGMLSVQERKLFDVMDHLSMTHHSDIEFVVVINERFWQQLDQTHRDILTDAARQVEKELRVEFTRIGEKATQIAIKNGLKIHHLSAEEKAAWERVSAPLRESYVKNAGDIGVELMLATEALRDRLAR